MRRRGSATVCRNGLLAAGAASVIVGEVWNIWFPINKKLWTSSYVLLAGGLALMALGLGYWLLDVERLQERSRAVRGAVWPLLVFGSNAITAFAISEVVVETLSWLKVSRTDDGSVSVWAWIYAHGFALHGSTRNTSLVFALVFVVLCFLPNWWLWRKKIFLRV
jgi:predicted acyltransferase